MTTPDTPGRRLIDGLAVDSAGAFTDSLPEAFCDACEHAPCIAGETDLCTMDPRTIITERIFTEISTEHRRASDRFIGDLNTLAAEATYYGTADGDSAYNTLCVMLHTVRRVAASQPLAGGQ